MGCVVNSHLETFNELEDASSLYKMNVSACSVKYWFFWESLKARKINLFIVISKAFSEFLPFRHTSNGILLRFTIWWFIFLSKNPPFCSSQQCAIRIEGRNLHQWWQISYKSYSLSLCSHDDDDAYTFIYFWVIDFISCCNNFPPAINIHAVLIAHRNCKVDLQSCSRECLEEVREILRA